MDHLYLNNDGWILIFYTGKQPLSPALENSNNNIKIIKQRPDLYNVIPNIIYGIEAGVGVPEKYNPAEKRHVKEVLAKKLNDLEELGLTEDEIMEELTSLAHQNGFLLSNIFQDESCPGKGILQVIKENFANDDKQTTAYGNKGPELRQRPNTKDYQRLQQRQIRKQASLVEDGYNPWEPQQNAAAFVKNLDKKSVKKTWGLLYCGGNKPVENTLREISAEFRIALYPESFAW